MIGLVRTSRRRRVQHVIRLNRASLFAPGLAGWWPVGNKVCWGSNTLLDISGFGNHGTLTNGPAWSGGGNRLALRFDDVDDFLDGATRDIWKFGTADFSVLMWVYPTSFSAESGLYDALILNGAGGRTDAFILVIRITSGVLGLFSVNAQLTNSATALVLNEWNHVGIVRTGAMVRYFVDGNLDANTVSMGTDIQSGGAIVGRYSDVASGFFAGSLDDVRIYRNRALSTVEVAEMYWETVDGGYGSLAAPRRMVVRAGAAAPAAGQPFHRRWRGIPHTAGKRFAQIGCP